MLAVEGRINKHMGQTSAMHATRIIAKDGEDNSTMLCLSLLLATPCNHVFACVCVQVE